MGTLLGWTQAESEWDDAERDQMIALQRHDDGVCECGFHESLIAPETLKVTFEDRVCPICAGAEQYGRWLAKQDKKVAEGLGEDSPARAPRPSDGRRTYIRPI